LAQNHQTELDIVVKDISKNHEELKKSQESLKQLQRTETINNKQAFASLVKSMKRK